MISFQKEILHKQRDYTVCWLFNIGLEDTWTTSHCRMRSNEENVAVQHMDEIMLLLAKEKDIVLLRNMPDSSYLQRLRGLGFTIPLLYCPRNTDMGKGIEELVLEDEKLLYAIKKYGENSPMYLLPYGVTEQVEQISRMCRIPLLGTSSAIVKKANSKLYARKLVKELSLHCPTDRECHSLKEIQDAWEQLRHSFRRIVIKRPFGASGQGLYLVDSEEKLQRILCILKRTEGERGVWLVEGWYENKVDLNAQLYIHQDGKIELFSIKRQLLEDAVYRGSLFPVAMPEETLCVYEKQLYMVGKRLYEQGVRGVIGMDSILTDQGLFPVIEINTRFTLSTYLSALPEMFPDRIFQSVYYRIIKKPSLSYERLEEKMEHLGYGFSSDTKQGVFFYNHACMADKTSKVGRLFVIYVSEDRDGLDKMRKSLEQQIRNVTEEE